MTTDLVVQDAPRQSVVLSTDQLKFIANTEFVPKDLRGNLPAILACVAYGRELGVGDMTALQGIDMIDGKPAPSAELCTYLARRAGHSLIPVWGDGTCTAKGRRGDNGDEAEFTFTLQMAERAGLLNKNNWKKYPEAMLWARAASQLCRILFADCFGGAGTYTAEELGDVGASEEAEPERLAAGGLTEPEVGSGSSGAEPEAVRASSGGDVARMEPVAKAGLASGSVSPWQQLTQLAKDAGIPLDDVKDAGRLMFPGRTPGSLTADECADLWAVVEAVQVTA